MTDSNTTNTNNDRHSSPQRLSHAKLIATASESRQQLQPRAKDLHHKQVRYEVADVDSQTRHMRRLVRKSETQSQMTDDCETVVDQHKKKTKQAVPSQQLRIPPTHPQTTTIIPHNPSPPIPNPSTQHLLLAPSLRQRFSHLLPPTLSLPIGFRQQRLLQKVSCLDRSITFITEHRSRKPIFFEDLRKNILQCLQTNINVEDLQRILFVAPGFYVVAWERNQRIKRYDLKMAIGSGSGQREKEEHSRRCAFRGAVVEYLMRLHEDMLEKMGDLQALEVGQGKWHKDFDVEMVEIPLGKLPEHPLDRHASIRDMSPVQINSISNSQLKKTIQQTISQSKSISVNEFSASAFLSQKKKIGEISNRIYQIVRQKQLHLKQQQQKKLQQKVQSQIVEKIMTEIIATYIGKNVCNMFEVTLVDLLRKRLPTTSVNEIKESIGVIKGLPGSFLAEVANPKGVILRVEKGRYNEVLAEFRSSGRDAQKT